MTYKIVKVFGEEFTVPLDVYQFNKDNYVWLTPIYDSIASHISPTDTSNFWFYVKNTLFPSLPSSIHKIEAAAVFSHLITISKALLENNKALFGIECIDGFGDQVFSEPLTATMIAYQYN